MCLFFIPYITKMLSLYYICVKINILYTKYVSMYTYILKKGGDLLNSNQKSEYGLLLTKLINDRNITQVKFYNELGIGKPYFYDILSGKINPPPPETQLKILRILKPEENEKKKLLAIAARERNEMPADILIYLRNNKSVIEKIRSQEEYQNYIGGIINE